MKGLTKASSRAKRYYDRKPKRREFFPGDRVLVLLSNDQNNLLVIWKGPFEVVEKVGLNDYRIKLPKGPKLLHGNQLKLYIDRQSNIQRNIPKNRWSVHRYPRIHKEPSGNRQPMYPNPFALRETIEKELKELLEMGLIEPSQTPYSSPVVMVRKTDGSNRFCVDYRKLNHVTKFDAEPLPNLDEVLP